MTLLKRLQDDIRASMKAGDRDRLSVLKLVLSAVKNREIAKRPKKLTENDIKDVIAKEIKDQEEAIKIYKGADEQERVKKLEAEMAVLREYLPAMSEKEVKILVIKAVKRVDAKSISDMGKVLGYVMPKVKGQASPETVKKLVAKTLKT